MPTKQPKKKDSWKKLGESLARRVRDDKGPKGTWPIERRCLECDCYWHPQAGEFEIHTIVCSVGRARALRRSERRGK